jgi:zinc D-Ala-D-Ala carboxypeptidase
VEWNKYPNFKSSEFACKHCGKVEMQPVFMDKLQQLRNAYGKPMIITSGYRCSDHPVESKKGAPGVHTMGVAADVAVSGTDAYKLLSLAFAHGFTGIGVNQKGGSRFLHLDTWQESPRPNVWSY